MIPLLCHPLLNINTREGTYYNQKAYLDVKVFNPFAPTHCSVSLTQYYRHAELANKRKYEERIREVEHGTFSPIVFSCTGGMGHRGV